MKKLDIKLAWASYLHDILKDSELQLRTTKTTWISFKRFCQIACDAVADGCGAGLGGAAGTIAGPEGTAFGAVVGSALASGLVEEGWSK